MDLSLVSTVETKSGPPASGHVTSAQMNDLRFTQLIFSAASRPTDSYLHHQNVLDKWLKVPLIYILGTFWEQFDPIVGDCDLSITLSFILFYTSAVCPQRSALPTDCRCFSQSPTLPKSSEVLSCSQPQINICFRYSYPL